LASAVTMASTAELTMASRELPEVFAFSTG
jgi:hypothetical protein